MTSEQFFPNELFQTLHLLTYGGLSTTHSGSCGSKSVQIGNSNKCSQQIEVEVNYRTICTYHILSLTGGSY
ncbi:Uncharacterised protein [Shigella sonnei]|nr:Uncharacterised protein [Shigella sonnei]